MFLSLGRGRGWIECILNTELQSSSEENKNIIQAIIRRSDSIFAALSL